jgi:hypothetical protein
MANRSSNTLAPGELFARLGGLLMALVSGKDRRLRETIASAVMRARRHGDLELMVHWNARRNPASNRRVE